MRRTLAAVGLFVTLFGGLALLAGCGSGTNPTDPHVAMGGHLFVQFACSSCHGMQGKGGPRGLPEDT
jgi:mono/diheme cytochrome c family protein